MEGKGKKIVIALGGNALKKPKETGTYEETMHNVMVTADQMVALMERGHKLVVTHGNGPQVGAIILQNQIAEPDVAALPMFVCGSESQGMLGFFLQQGLRNELVSKKSRLAGVSIATIVTQVEVDKNDPAFQDPTKPIGKFYSKEDAMKLRAEGKTVVEDAGRGYRVVVASPTPKSIIEKDAIKALVDGGHIVIASGGGGIPVIRDEDDILHGVDAVIDKDLAGEVLAEVVEAEMFVILTDVDAAYTGWGTPEKRALPELTVAEAEKLISEGQFARGSMLPKVRAAMNFVRKTGSIAIITSLDRAVDAVDGKAGTRIVP
eukprot:TRINITY_DN80244_c0_g1_i1.p2 TRINITY_DN80244_c0_g1~~TRINITY_DN80244_c0_g1_i1.p2  ORF type:complete len:319 (+),score=116.89 TRINITY_DN80244_c0_g1_i1:83-1039(+)